MDSFTREAFTSFCEDASELKVDHLINQEAQALDYAVKSFSGKSPVAMKWAQAADLSVQRNTPTKLSRSTHNQSAPSK
jgi:hypothetical protein